MGYTFDGPNRRIHLSPGTTVLDLVDMHSRWKDWVRAGNAGYLPAFSAVGGDIAEIPLYLFLANGWRIVPQQANHTLSVTGGILEVDGGGDPFVDPAGSYKIRINRQAPGIAIGYSSAGSGGPTAGTIADAVRSALGIDLTRLQEVWGRLQLDPANPLRDTRDAITFGDVTIALARDADSVTGTRQP